MAKHFLDVDKKLKKMKDKRISLSLDEWEKLKGAVNYIDKRLLCR